MGSGTLTLQKDKKYTAILNFGVSDNHQGLIEKLTLTIGSNTLSNRFELYATGNDGTNISYNFKAFATQSIGSSNITLQIDLDDEHLLNFFRDVQLTIY